MKTAHFVLTRFNESAPEMENPNRGLDQDWLKHRMELFETVTIPSIESQSNQDFYWLVKCHCLTPQWARERLNHKKIIPDYRKSEDVLGTMEQNRLSDGIYSRMHPCNRTICRYYFQNTIKSMIDSCEKIITTSLDSDDALAFDHIEKVKNRIALGKFFDFNIGLAKIENRYFLQRRHTRHVSPFYSYCEPAHRTIRTFFYLPHTLATNTDYLNEIGWMQCCHENNIYNKPNLSLPIDKDLVMEKFPYVRL